MIPMTQITKLLLTLLLCMMGMSGFAANPDDGDNMYVFTKQSSTPVVYSLEELNKITFSSSGINVWKAQAPTTYAYSDFRLITFSPDVTPSGIAQLSMEEAGITISYDHQQEMVSVQGDNTLSGAAVYDVQGRLVAVTAAEARNLQVSLLTLPQGIYLVKVATVKGLVSKKIVK